jgi:hypothetical protein
MNFVFDPIRYITYLWSFIFLSVADESPARQKANLTFLIMQAERRA